MSEHDKRGYYRALNSDPNTSSEELKRSYRRLALRHHPDREQDPARRQTQQDRMRLLNEAYDALRDPDRRTAYNRECNFPRCSRHPDSFLSGPCRRCSDPVCPRCAPTADRLCRACGERADRRRRTSDPVERALLAIEDGELVAAQDELRTVLLSNPRDVVALTALSTVREKQGDLAGAVALLKAALRLKPGHGLSHFRLGSLHHRMGDLDAARPCYEEALRLNPGNSRYQGALASLQQPPEDAGRPQYRLNDRVRHQVFGSGVVTEVTPAGVRVTFGDGDTRWLDPGRAPMVRHF